MDSLAAVLSLNNPIGGIVLCILENLNHLFRCNSSEDIYIINIFV